MSFGVTQPAEKLLNSTTIVVEMAYRALERVLDDSVYLKKIFI